jgi:uncharacterized membrane protein
MESLLHEGARYVALAIQTIAILVVATGSARALIEGWRVARGRRPGDVEGRTAWLRYGRWLVAGLTFQLAADIVGTSFSPRWDEVGRLAAVAAVRTFLSYFLDREMEHTLTLQRVGRSERRAGTPADGD